MQTLIITTRFDPAARARIDAAIRRAMAAKAAHEQAQAQQKAS